MTDNHTTEALSLSDDAGAHASTHENTAEAAPVRPARTSRTPKKHSSASTAVAKSASRTSKKLASSSPDAEQSAHTTNDDALSAEAHASPSPRKGRRSAKSTNTDSESALSVTHGHASSDAESYAHSAESKQSAESDQSTESAEGAQKKRPRRTQQRNTRAKKTQQEASLQEGLRDAETVTQGEALSVQEGNEKPSARVQKASRPRGRARKAPAPQDAELRSTPEMQAYDMTPAEANVSEGSHAAPFATEAMFSAENDFSVSVPHIAPVVSDVVSDGASDIVFDVVSDVVAPAILSDVVTDVISPLVAPVVAPALLSETHITPDTAHALSTEEEDGVVAGREGHAEEEEDHSKGRRARRGSRGGRSKRGKKSLASAAEDDAFESPIEEKHHTKAGTSLATGKPGRAQTLAKKTNLPTARRKMFISVVPGEQVEVALVEEGAIHEYYLEMLHQVKTKGNIYKGVIHNIDTNLQAAFVNYGGNKNGFLQIDEIHPEYYQVHHESTKNKRFPPIQKALKQGQEVLVQVVKEPTGNKGAFLTTWLSLPGRFLVLTPGQEQIGISRKVDNEEERSRLRELMTGIEPGAGLGVIVRTVSAGTSKTTLKTDLQYLKRIWREIRKRGVQEVAPQLIYQEPDLAERSIRDYLTDDIAEVWVDNADVAEALRETVSLLFPRKKDLIRIHADVRQTLWERFNIQRQLEQIYSREVTLPSGGRLVFDQTEALMAVDINSGKISGKVNFESMALKTNIEAAEAIARHLKLRDIGGQVVIDFIEMRDKSHVREVEKTLRNAMKNDRARHDVARMSSFGLLEIVRQRTGSSALAITMEACPHCRGTGTRRNLEWQALRALREIARQGHAHSASTYVYETSSELALYLLNQKKQRLCQLEEQLQKHVEIRIRI